MKRNACPPHSFGKVGQPYRPVTGYKSIRVKEYRNCRYVTVTKRQEIRGALTQRYFCGKCEAEREVRAGDKV